MTDHDPRHPLTNAHDHPDDWEDLIRDPTIREFHAHAVVSVTGEIPVVGVNKRVPREYPVAHIEELYDGDTWRLFIDQGFDEWAKKWIRIKDLHTQELHKPGGKAALRLAADTLNRYAPDGWVKLYTFWTPGSYKQIREEMTFMRYVGRVVAPDGVDVGEVLRSLIAGTEMEGGG